MLSLYLKKHILISLLLFATVLYLPSNHAACDGSYAASPDCSQGVLTSAQ